MTGPIYLDQKLHVSVFCVGHKENIMGSHLWSLNKVMFQFKYLSQYLV